MCCFLIFLCSFFLYNQWTAYEIRISDLGSDVCSSDLVAFDKHIGELDPFQADGGRVFPDQDGVAGEAALAAADDDPGFRGASADAEIPFEGRRVAGSEERRVGKEWCRECRTRGSPEKTQKE